MVSDFFGSILRNNSIVLIVEIITVLILTVVVAKSFERVLSRYFKVKSRKIKIEETKFLVLQRLIVMTVYIIGIVIAGSMIPGFSSLGVSLFASAGIIAVVLGFAAQQAFSNVISGIFIAMFEPIKVGDRVMIKEDYGVVEDITLRHTVIKTWDEKRIIIPNSRLSEEYIINYSIKDPKVLGTLDIGISYDSDIDEARRIMVEIALNHPDLPKKVKGEGSEFLSRDELVKVKLIELTDFAQKLRLYYWAPERSTAIKMKHDLTESIKKRFDSEGIEIPFPYRTIVYKKDLQ